MKNLIDEIQELLQGMDEETVEFVYEIVRRLTQNEAGRL